MIRSPEPRTNVLTTCVVMVGFLLCTAQMPAQPPESPAQQAETGAADSAVDGLDSEVEPKPPGSVDPAEIPPPNIGAQHTHDHARDHELTAEGKQAQAEYDQAQRRLVDAMIEMRTLHTLYCNGEGRTPEAAERYLELRANMRGLMNDLYGASMKLLVHSDNEQAAQFMITMIQNREENDIYDVSTLVGGANLIDAGLRYVFLLRAVARSAVANGDFKIAKRLYEVLEDEHLEDVDRRLMYQMESIESQWNEEIKQRELDHQSDHLPRVRLKTTRGDVVLELFIDQAPSTVSHFIQLVEEGFYDGLDFYQVIEHLLALTGDPAGNGSGNSGDFLLDEHTRESARHALRGSLAMAKWPADQDKGEFVPNTGSSQFAIFLLPVPTVSSQQTVFGRVIEGMDAISSLRRVDPSKKKKKNEVVMPPDRIITAEVIRRPEKLPEPKYYQAEALARPAR